jgi:hypothetical protein
MSLVMPDICGKLEDPMLGSTARFVTWFETYMQPKYAPTLTAPTLPFPALPVPLPPAFLSGRDCYALRCAYLHEGSLDVSTQRIQEVINLIVFVAPQAEIRVHCNMMITAGRVVLQLQADIFCEDMCQGVEEWLKRVASDPAIQGRMSSLPTISVTAREMIPRLFGY